MLTTIHTAFVSFYGRNPLAHMLPPLRRLFLAKALPVLWVLLCVASVRAQDSHFSQFYHYPVQLNPARAGVFKSDWRASALYRSQWNSVPVSYQTAAGNFEWKPLQRRRRSIALALQLKNDQAGDASLRRTELGGIVAAQHLFSKSMALSAGFGMKFVQTAFDLSALKFQNQWNGEFFSANFSSKENFSRSSGVFTTLSAGLNLHLEKPSKRTRLDLGGGAFHLNKPEIGFRQDKLQTLSMRLAFLADGCLQVGEQTDWVAYSGVQRMSKAMSVITGGGVRRILNQERGRNLAIQGTLGLRWGDALIPAIQVEYETWTVGLSYDLNLSPFNEATSGRGGPEIAVIYKPVPPAPPKTFKSCPIF